MGMHKENRRVFNYSLAWDLSILFLICVMINFRLLKVPKLKIYRMKKLSYEIDCLKETDREPIDLLSEGVLQGMCDYWQEWTTVKVSDTQFLLIFHI